MSRRAVLGACAAAVSVPIAIAGPAVGCALASRGERLDVAWYTPERTRPSQAVAERQGRCPLRLGRVSSGADFGPRIAFSNGLYEVGYYDARRWTERPEHYVRRALQRELFEGGSFERSSSVEAPRMDLELLDFEEVKAPALHAARVAVRVVVTSEHAVSEHTVEASHPVAGTSFDAVVAAMAESLEDAARQVALDPVVASGCR
jgi:cholesterol transport system auxiliary component